MFTHFFDFLQTLRQRRRWKMLALLQLLEQLPEDDEKLLTSQFYEKYPYFKQSISLIELLKKYEDKNSCIDAELLSCLEDFLAQYKTVEK